MRILYVEDNPANLYLVKRVAHNHEIINYIDGEEALANFNKDQPDLVLMDIQLAGHLSGLEVVRKLRADGHKVPIVAVTAYAMVGDREQAMAAGCDDYLAKPLPIPQFIKLLEHYSEQFDQVQEVTTNDPTATYPAPSTEKGADAEEVTGANEAAGTSESEDVPVDQKSDEAGKDAITEQPQAEKNPVPAPTSPFSKNIAHSNGNGNGDYSKKNGDTDSGSDEARHGG